jgi:hypothetical protein
VIAIALFRLPFFRGSVLEQNLTRTSASVGEALVAGAVFTIPAFMMVNVAGERLWLGLKGHYWESTVILLAGGLLGIFFIIILRRPLVVESDLPFPESKASAEVVKAGQAGATDAPKYVFGALGLGALMQVLKDGKGLQVFHDTVAGFIPFPRSVISHFGLKKEPIGDVVIRAAYRFDPFGPPALIGIGYIIGFVGRHQFFRQRPGLDDLIPSCFHRSRSSTPARCDDGRTLLRPAQLHGLVQRGAPHRRGCDAGCRHENPLRHARPIVRSRGALSRPRPPRTPPQLARARHRYSHPWIVAGIIGMIIPITLIYQHFVILEAAIAAALVMTFSGSARRWAVTSTDGVE